MIGDTYAAVHQLSLGLEQRYIYIYIYIRKHTLAATYYMLGGHYLYTIAGMLFHLLYTDITTGVMLNY